jgi:hypothetical protein
VTIQRVFAGYDQSDCASMQIASVLYRAYSYRVARYIGVIGGVSIRVRCFVEQPNAQEVELFDTEVASNGGDVGVNLDCPKLIAVGTTLVCCWLQTEAGAVTLHMGTLNIGTMGTFGPSWTDQGSVSTHDSGLYDLVCIDNDQYFDHDDDEYVVVLRTDVDEFQIRRHDGFDWISTSWITNYTTPANIADSILMAHAFESLVQPSFLVTYQTDAGGDEDAGVIRTTRFTSTNGVQTHDTVSFTAIPAAVRATQASHQRLTLNRVALAVEYADDVDLGAEDLYVRWIACVVLDATDTSQASAEQNFSNLHMLSRLFALPGLSDVASPTPRLFLAVGFKNMGATWTYEGDVTVYESGTEWAQSLPMILDLDWTRWSDHGDLEVRPFVVAQMPFTVGDCRVGGTTALLADPVGSSSIDGRRTNHLSHVTDPPDFGPSVKSMTFAHGAFGRTQNVGISTGALEATESKVNPVAALVRGWEFNYEDPWVTWRDGRTEPSANWKGVCEIAQHQARNVGRHLILGGSTPVAYDGVQVVELGFPWDPEIVSANGTLEGGSPDGLGAGVYIYTAIYEWSDSFGVVHRSGPAVPVSIELGDPGPDSNQVVLRIRTMTVSLRDNMAVYPDAHSIHIVVYRTTAGGSTFFRLHCLDNAFQSRWSVDHTPLNDPTTWAITVTDALPDATLTAVSDPLPWPILDTSGVAIPLTPQRVPASAVMAVFQERLWMVSMEDPDELRYSLTLRKGFAPEFNDANTVRRDNLGPVTGAAAMDQQLVIFTPDRIYSVQGRVQDDTGSDGDIQIYLLAEGVGCFCQRSVVVTAGEGIFFQARKGYYQLDRGGATTFVGADVEDYIGESGMVLAATLLEQSHEIRLVCNTSTREPVVLRYNYLHKMWSRELPVDFVVDDADRAKAAHGMQWRGLDGEVCHVLLQQGAVGFERAASDLPFADTNEDGDDVAIPVDIQTSWIHTAGIGGLQRIWSILLTLDRPNASQITVTLEFDQGGYGTADVTQNIVFASGTVIPLRCRPSVQKCTAFRIRIRETGSVPTTENISITAITLIAGVKRGHSRVPAAQIG